MANLKPGDVVKVSIYETLAYETYHTLTAADFVSDGVVDVCAIEQTIIEDGVDWNACEVTSREVHVDVPDA